MTQAAKGTTGGQGATLDQVTVYTDGGADPNPGPGGWGAVLLHAASGSQRELSGGDERTTNNRMELTAAIEALASLTRRCRIELYTDSQYLRKGITQWLQGWKARGWTRKNGDPVLNADLWRRLAELTGRHEVHWHWVKGHAGHRHNEQADALATAEIRRRQGALSASAAGSPASAVGPAKPADVEVFLKVRSVGQQGGWGALIRRGDEEETITGVQRGVTANRLDILAAAQVLESLPEGATVDLYTGSDYLRNGATQWLEGWRRRAWKTGSGDPVKNADAWRRLDAALRRCQVRWPVEKGTKRPETKVLEAAVKAAMSGG